MPMILDSFGIIDPILRQGVSDVDMGYWDLWNPSGAHTTKALNNETGRIERRKRHGSSPGKLSRYGQILLNQGAVEEVFLDYLKGKGQKVERNLRAVSMEISQGSRNPEDDFPVAVEVKRVSHKDDEDGESKIGMDHSDIGPKDLINMAQKVMKPYQLTYKYCDWWSIYPGAKE
ncbi:hypothetical protein ATERTT37_004337 [Aspergillus terreus]